MDFNQDADTFAMLLARSGRDVKRARENFLDLIHHWMSLSENRFGKMVVIELLPDAQGFAGSVFGKSFSIRLSPIITGETGTIEAVVTVSSIPQGHTEIGRFQVDRDGKLIGDDFLEGANTHQDTVSVRVFMAVLKAVLEASVKVEE